VVISTTATAPSSLNPKIFCLITSSYDRSGS
jgi:hypothetical protein